MVADFEEMSVALDDAVDDIHQDNSSQSTTHLGRMAEQYVTKQRQWLKRAQDGAKCRFARVCEEMLAFCNPYRIENVGPRPADPVVCHCANLVFS